MVLELDHLRACLLFFIQNKDTKYKMLYEISPIKSCWKIYHTKESLKYNLLNLNKYFLAYKATHRLPESQLRDRKMFKKHIMIPCWQHI